MICRKLCGNCEFPQNFHTWKLGESMIFLAVRFESKSEVTFKDPFHLSSFICIGLNAAAFPSLVCYIKTFFSLFSVVVISSLIYICHLLFQISHTHLKRLFMSPCLACLFGHQCIKNEVQLVEAFQWEHWSLKVTKHWSLNPLTYPLSFCNQVMHFFRNIFRR